MNYGFLFNRIREIYMFSYERTELYSTLTHQKLMIKLSNSSGLKESDAVKIDAVLKGLKFSGNTTVQNEAKNETRRYLDYEIDF